PAFGTNIQGTVVPGRTTQRVHTSVELEDGQTLVIGGLIQKVVRGSTQKVPILCDLPFLGAGLRSKALEEQGTELVVMVTPHLVDAMDCAQAPKLLPGQETRTPDDFELFLEGILEAPRGSREVCPDGRYVPAYKHSPSAATFPCAGGNGCGGGSCAAPCASPSIPGGGVSAEAAGHAAVAPVGDAPPAGSAGATAAPEPSSPARL